MPLIFSFFILLFCGLIKQPPQSILREDMRAVIQKVLEANIGVVESHELVHVDHIDQGLVVLVGITHDDTNRDVAYVADKIAHMRIFADADDKMNLSIQDVAGEILLVSQFTLFGDMRNGRRPSFIEAARPQQARALYNDLADLLMDMGLVVKTGHFRTHMNIELNNDGPVTILLDSKKLF